MNTIEISSADPFIIMLCTRYWDADLNNNFKSSLTKIAEETSISTYKIIDITKKNSICKVPSGYCDICGSETHNCIKLRRDLRAALLPRTKGRNICSNCQDEINKKNEQMRLDQTNEISKRLSETIKNATPFELEKLSFIDKIYLLSIYLHAGNENLTRLTKIKTNNGINLAPPDITLEIIDDLKNKEIILIDPNSDIRLLTSQDRTAFLNVNYLVNIDFSNTNMTNHLDNLHSQLSLEKCDEKSKQELFNLIKNICIYICKKYLSDMLTSKKLPVRIGEKTHAAILLSIENYSTSNVLKFIWLAVNEASNYYKRGKPTTQQQAVSIIPNVIVQFANKPPLKEGKLAKFNRPANQKSSTLENVISSLLFKENDALFNLTLSEIKKILLT